MKKRCSCALPSAVTISLFILLLSTTTLTMTSSFVPPVTQSVHTRPQDDKSPINNNIQKKRRKCDWGKVTQEFTLHLSASSSSGMTDAYSSRTKGKDKSKEFALLAKKLNIEKKDLKKLLWKQRSIVVDEEKKQYIDWLLDYNAKSASVTASSTQERLGEGSKVSDEGNMTKDKNRKKNSKKGKKDSKKMKEDSPAQASAEQKERQEVEKDASTTTATKKNKKQPSFLTQEQFSKHKDIHPSSKRALTDVLQLQYMTEIQSKTFTAASSGKDVLGRARTGTGKTLAFLIPALEHLLQCKNYRHGETVGVLVISPTRELASQIGDQAEKLLTYHKKMNVQVIFGGTNMKRDVSALQKRIPTILVATPGRLLDHLQSTTVHNKQFGKDIMCHTPSVVLDETDRLLDMGFRNDIKKILTYLPKSDERQTLLFSATIPEDLKDIMAQTMKDDYIEVDCIHDKSAGTEAHTDIKIKQSHVIIPTFDRYLSSLVEVVQLAQKQEDSPKIVVFFVTARMVSFFAELFNQVLNIPVIELHSKKSQSYRNRASDEFRSADSAILFTSDVSARGVDYPSVTQVIQFGLPMNREQYIHRLGRTGRAGKEGVGWLVLGPFESMFLQELKDIDIPRNEQLDKHFHESMDADVGEALEVAREKIQGTKKLRSSAQGAYQAFLGFYLGQMKRMKMRRKEDLVELANDFSSQMGLKEVPGLTKNMVGKMGLKGINGIVLKSKEEEAEIRGRGRGRGPGRASSASPRGKRDHNDGKKAPNSSGRRMRRLETR